VATKGEKMFIISTTIRSWCLLKDQDEFDHIVQHTARAYITR